MTAFLLLLCSLIGYYDTDLDRQNRSDRFRKKITLLILFFAFLIPRKMKVQGYPLQDFMLCYIYNDSMNFILATLACSII